MKIEDKEALAHTGDITLEASAIRLMAARAVAGVTQLDVAKACGIKKSAYGNMETALSFPSRPVMKYFYRQHRIDFNFLMHGDFAQLPGDVAEALWPALADANARLDQKRHSGQAPNVGAPGLPRTT